MGDADDDDDDDDDEEEEEEEEEEEAIWRPLNGIPRLQMASRASKMSYFSRLGLSIYIAYASRASKMSYFSRLSLSIYIACMDVLDVHAMYMDRPNLEKYDNFCGPGGIIIIMFSINTIIFE